MPKKNRNKNNLYAEAVNKKIYYVHSSTVKQWNYKSNEHYFCEKIILTRIYTFMIKYGLRRLKNIIT